MSTPIQEYDIAKVLKLVGLGRSATPQELALIDRLFMIHEGNVQKTANDFKRRIHD